MDTISRLIEQLADTRTEVRQQAADGLGSIGPQARPAMGKLVLAAADPQPQVQAAAKRALAAVDADWAQSQEAESVVADLTRRLGRRGSSAVCQVLMQIGAKAVSGLVGLLAEADTEGIRQAEAIRTLGQIGVAAEPAVPAISQALRTGPIHVQRAAVAALSSIGQNAAQAVPALTAALGKLDSDVREHAARALQVFSQEQVDLLPLVYLLGDREEQVRQAAAATLQIFGAPAVPPLIAILQTREAWRNKEQWGQIVEVIAQALPREMIGFTGRREYIVPATVFYEIEECAWVASQRLQGAAAVLGALGPAASESVAVLGELLRERDQRVRAAAAHALGRIGPHGRSAVPGLARLLGDEDEDTRTAAVESLSKLDPDWPAHPEHASVVGALLVRLDQGPERTKRLEGSLAKVGPAIVPLLTERLASPSRLVREATCRVLGSMGATAASSLPALQTVAEAADENRYVREAAQAAMRKIRGASPGGQM